MSKSRGQSSSMSIKGQNVIGVINASGSARLNVNQQIIHQVTPEMDKLFKSAHKRLSARPEDPKVDQAKLKKQVRKIEAEAAKGEAADQSRLERWLKTLAQMAPDIVEVMAASLAGPVAGFTLVFKKIVERAKAASVEA